MSDVIYRPFGRALEYAPRALNLYQTCDYACRYCYVPQAMHKKVKDFHQEAKPRKDILARIKKDCEKLRGMEEEVLLCFGCDPYPRVGNELTREALFILAAYDMKVTILTKNPGLALRDFRLIAENEWSFGITLAWDDDKLRQDWEPNAPSVMSRIGGLIAAKAHGIRTWVSVEPVMDPDEAIQAIINMKPHVDHFKVGKLNGRTPETREIEKGIDWRGFASRVRMELHGHSFYIKKDLAEYETDN